MHLDVVPDLSAGTFIRSFKRFIGRRGIPRLGGFFERLNCCVKRCLEKILQNARLTYEELVTVDVDIECV